jgi:hypothetical protein
MELPIVPTQRKPLGRLIGAYKAVSTQRVNDLRSTPGAQLWQRNYHVRVIRKSISLRALRRYIAPTIRMCKSRSFRRGTVREMACSSITSGTTGRSERSVKGILA